MSNSTPLVDQLAAVEAAVDAWGVVASDAEGIQAIQRMEAIKAKIASQQVKITAQTLAHRHNAELAADVPRSRWGNGLGGEIGLARMQSPARGSDYLKHADMLTRDLPATYATLQSGQLTEEAANIVARETSWLSREDRQQVDALIQDRLTAGLGPRQLGHEVRAHAYQVDPPGAVKRHAKATSERRVSVRPAADGMAYLTALLPMPEAVSAYVSLRTQAQTIVTAEHQHPNDATRSEKPDDATGDQPVQRRTRDQVMADLAVEFLTGRQAATDVPAHVQLVMTDATLFGDDSVPAWVAGHGPIPAGVAKRWLANTRASVLLQRVFTRPSDGRLVRLESKSRSFPKGLRSMVLLRDQVCRTPYCDAPIREIDHIRPFRDGGPTAWTNSSGLCAGCNQSKENTGWTHQAGAVGLRVTTPTGHTYTKRDGPVLPGKPPDDKPPDNTTHHDPKPDNPPGDPPDEKPPDKEPPQIASYRCRGLGPILTETIDWTHAA